MHKMKRVQDRCKGENITVEVNESPMLVPQSTCSYVSNSSFLMCSTESDDCSTSKKRKLNKSNKMNEEFHEAVIATLRDNKQPDVVDGCLLLLGEGLRKIPYRE
ncbi:uncharacterized protein LOC112588263 [Harpegnathos saltator]|uniref:uncharacterized protein LOC112588263 n=1 Tax=Harpegnathos saltator TaxID=610380 RepID=UPI000DBED76F|nr:uncharacterized protein LOC112588263 [Harpegnathos saltator]